MSQAALPGVDTSRPHSEELEQWFTPPELARHVVEFATFGRVSDRIIEPTAGDGALVRAAYALSAERADPDALPIDVQLCEIDRRCAAVLRVDFPRAHHQCADVFTVGFKPANVAICNPPFALACAVLDHVLNFVPRAVSLLPTSALHGVERSEFWARRRLARLAILSSRPRFIGAKNISPATDFVVAEVFAAHPHAGDPGVGVEWWP